MLNKPVAGTRSSDHGLRVTSWPLATPREARCSRRAEGPQPPVDLLCVAVARDATGSHSGSIPASQHERRYVLQLAADQCTDRHAVQSPADVHSLLVQLVA